MADLTQTAANVGLSGSAGQIKIVQAGAAVTQGEPVYQLAADSTHHPCDVNDTAAKAAAVGIALTPAATSGFFAVALPGCLVNLGATLVVGTIYMVSESGAIMPESDKTSGDYPTILGIATAADTLPLDITLSATVVP
jgi:hypothetical protein